MAGATTELDSDLLEELRFVDRVQTLFKTAGIPMAFWEAYCLSQSNRARLSLELDRSSRDIPTELLESLRTLRARGGPIVRKLHQFLEPPRSLEDTDRQEMALAVLVGSAKGREAVGRWIEEPARYAGEAAERVRLVLGRLEPVRQALRPGSPPIPELPPPPPPSETPAASEPSPSAPAPSPAPAPPAEPPPAEIMVAAPGVTGELVVFATPGRVALAWQPVPGATRYTVKRSDAKGASYAVIATPEECSWLDEKVTPGKVYFYQVSASSVAGEGGDSPPAQAAVPGPPAAPERIAAAPGVGRVTLTWDAVPDAAEYRVKRSAEPGGARETVCTLPATTFVDTGVAAGTTYRYVVSAVGPAGEGADSAPASAGPLGPPPAPTDLKISSGNARLLLNWAAAPGATSYTVKRATAPGGPYETIAASIAHTAQGDVPPQRGTTYYYVVRAAGPGGEGPDSAPISKALPLPPPAPTGLVATPGNGRVALAWVPSPGAARYAVKRRPAESGPYAPIATPTGPSHVDTSVKNGVAYEYVVSAASPAGEGADSAPARAEPLGPPQAPAGFTAEGGDGQVLLAWKPAAKSVEYRVQRSVARDAFFVEIARFADATTYVDRNVTNGTGYEYLVIASNAGGTGPASPKAKATPMAAPAAPRGLQGSASQGRVLLTWAASAAATQYKVTRAASAEGPFEAVGTTGETTYVDASVTDGTTYYYKVAASNGGGESEGAGPLAATPVDRPAPPAGLTASPGNGEIKLTWQPSAGAASYVLKRATSPGGPFTTLAEATETSHVDRDVDSRTTYHYTVAAVNAAGRSTASDAIAASPKPR